LNVFKLFYHIVVGSMGRLHVYEERTGKYLSYFKRYVGNAKVIVDVGCGAGAFSKALARQERLVIAIDVEKRLLREIENPYIEKVCADAHRLPLRDGSADCVLCLSLLEHLKSPEKCVEELYRVLKYGGTAIIQLPNLQYPFEPHTKWPLLCLMPKRLQSRILEMIGYPYINMEVTIKNALSTLQRAGFKPRETVKVYHLGIMKLLPIAPAYILMTEKSKRALPFGSC
jgi:ubiquinone/menaquinone biosynthesis C-methylase UbiE